MNGKTARNLAILMIVMALGLGLYAVRLGRDLDRPAPNASADAGEQQQLARVVVAIRALEPGLEIPADALSLASVAVVPEGSFSRVEEVAGRSAAHALSPGEPVLAKHFRPRGPISRSLEPGERAVAVGVDGVIGLGGFIQPGDRVDVLLYLARDTKEIGASQARMLLEDVRVLAYGAKVEETEEKSAPALDARTAVLAVPDGDVPRLMLGVSKGRVRLSLRGGKPEEALAREVRPVATLAGIGVTPPPKPSAGSGNRPRRKTGGRVAVYRGDSREMVRY